MKTPMELNKRLAELLGWTNLFDAGGTLIGCPPGGAANSRDQAAVPNWAGDWAATGPLSAECRIDLEWAHDGSSAIAIINTIGMYRKFVEQLTDHATPDAAARLAILRAAICQMEVSQ